MISNKITETHPIKVKKKQKYSVKRLRAEIEREIGEAIEARDHSTCLDEIKEYDKIISDLTDIRNKMSPKIPWSIIEKALGILGTVGTVGFIAFLQDSRVLDKTLMSWVDKRN